MANSGPPCTECGLPAVDARSLVIAASGVSRGSEEDDARCYVGMYLSPDPKSNVCAWIALSVTTDIAELLAGIEGLELAVRSNRKLNGMNDISNIRAVEKVYIKSRSEVFVCLMTEWIWQDNGSLHVQGIGRGMHLCSRQLGNWSRSSMMRMLMFIFGVWIVIGIQRR